jgi:hypothetical protein
MNFSCTGIIIPLTFFISIIMFAFLLIIYESLTIKRLFVIILNEISEYIPILAFLISADVIYSINLISLSPLTSIFINLFCSLVTYPLVYCMMLIVSYISEITL